MTNKYPRIGDVAFSNPWAITPEYMGIISDILDPRMEGLDVSAAAGDFKFSPPEPWDAGAVRVIPMVGTMAKRANMFMQISGGVSTELTGKAIQEAVKDPNVSAIVLDIDSPGGMVDGAVTLADLVFQARQEKPVVAFGNGTLASAAYLVGSAADQIVANETARVGSIGVIMRHTNRSKANERAGVEYKFVTSRTLKAAGNDAGPLEGAALAYFEELINEADALLIDKIARNRDTTAQAVSKMSGEARIYGAKKALEIGMIDRIGELADAIDMARELAAKETDSNSPWGGNSQMRETRGRSNTMQTYEDALALMHEGKADQVTPENQAKIAANAGKTPEEATAKKEEGGLMAQLLAAITGTKEKAEDTTPEPEALDTAAVLEACDKAGLSATQYAAIVGVEGVTTKAALNAVVAHMAETNKALANVDKAKETAVSVEDAEKTAAAGLAAAAKDLGIE